MSSHIEASSVTNLSIDKTIDKFSKFDYNSYFRVMRSVMTSLRLPKAAASIAMGALLCSTLVQPVYAGSSASITFKLDPATNMRQLPAAPGVDDSTGAPTSAYPSTPGCSTTQGQAVFKGLLNTAGFSLAQKVAVHINTLQMPTAISSCLQDLLNNFDKFTSAFSDGFSFSAVIKLGFQSALKNMVTDLENKACQDIKNAESGIIGDINKSGFSSLLNGVNGTIVISANPGGGGTTTPTTPTSSCPTPTQSAQSTQPLSYPLETGTDKNGNPIYTTCQDGGATIGVGANATCYYCPSGGLSTTGKTPVCYSCPSGYNLSGTTCTCASVSQ